MAIYCIRRTWIGTVLVRVSSDPKIPSSSNEYMQHHPSTTSLSYSSNLGRDNSEINSRTQTSVGNRVVTRVRVRDIALLERVLDTNDSPDISSLVELLRLHIARDIDADYAAGLESALDTGAGAELGVKSWLAGWTDRGGHVEGIAADCGGADAAKVGDLPGPWCGAGDGCC